VAARENRMCLKILEEGASKAKQTRKVLSPKNGEKSSSNE
jgi:hypothetical protein